MYVKTPWHEQVQKFVHSLSVGHGIRHGKTASNGKWTGMDHLHPVDHGIK